MSKKGDNKKLSDFDKLRLEWYRKIKDEGFQDIEPFFNYNHNIFDSRISSKHKRLKINENTEYYRLASMFTHDYDFTSDFDKLVWEHHVDGVSYRKIAILLGTTLRQVFNAMSRNKMQFKNYNPDLLQD